VIGHYLLTLTAEQEDRVLTRAVSPMLGLRYGCRCLVATVLDRIPTWYEKDMETAAPQRGYGTHRYAPAYRYEELADRFGVERVNAAIRNRILSNRARRELSPVSRETVAADSGGAHQ